VLRPWLPLLLPFLLSACDETSVVLVIHSNQLTIPAQLDAVCLQIAGDGKFQFKRRYPLREADAGAPRTLSVLPGDRTSSGFEVLLRGERRGWEVAWLRESATFEEHTVKEKHLYLERCGTRPGQGRFGSTQQLTNQPGSAVAAAPIAFAPSVAVVAWSGEARRFAHIQGSIKQLPGGTPAVPSGGAVRDLVAVDVDGDCDLDLVLLHELGPQVWKHGDTGTFQEQAGAILLTGDYHRAVAADFDLDGYVDLVLVSPTEVRLLLNNGNGTGTFRDMSQLLPSGIDDVTDVAVGFLNRGAGKDPDYYPDIVLARGDATKPNVVLLNSYSGGNVSFTRVDLSDPRDTRSVAVADLDGDGLQDVVFGNAPVASGVSGLPQVFFNKSTDEDVSLELRSNVLINASPDAVDDILVADLDDDCDEDVVLARSTSTMIYLNDGQGAFVESPSGPQAKASRVAAIDMNGDSVLDLVLGGEEPGAFWLAQEKLIQ